MADNYVQIGTLIINFPSGYDYTPVNLETHDRTIDGSMITNYTVDSDNNYVIKHIWSIQGIAKLPSTFLGATETACTVYCLGVTYPAKIMSQNYQLIRATAIGEKVTRYNLVIEEV